MDDFSNSGFIVIHLGAGYHSKSKVPAYKELVRRACRLGTSLCNDGHLASYIACQVVALLENSDLTNAGYGSNLTRKKTVQCDASLMDSKNDFAAVGSIDDIMNPIKVAYDLLESQNEEHFGLVPPVFLVGQGAKQWAAERGFTIVSNNELTSQCALRAYEESSMKIFAQCRQNHTADNEINNCCEQDLSSIIYEQKALDQQLQNDDANIDFDACHDQRRTFLADKSIRKAIGCKGKRKNQETMRNLELMPGHKRYKHLDNCGIIDVKNDTVGAICIDNYGNVCAAVSSGGLILKQPGRVGQAACYGCGCFVAEKKTEEQKIICASSTSGCGEQLIKTLLAKHCVDVLMADFDGEACLRNKGCRFDENLTCNDCNAVKYGRPAYSAKVNGGTDIGLQDTSCTMRQHPSDLSNINAKISREMLTFKDYDNELPNLLDNSFLRSSVLKDEEKKIAGCINIRLTKQLFDISENNAVEKIAVQDSLEDKERSSHRPCKCSVDLIISSTAHTFCVGFMSTKDKNSKFLLLKMPDVEKVGRTSITQEFHFEL